MKAQYAKILEWQKEVEEIHENHKQKFMKAKHVLETVSVLTVVSLYYKI